MQIELKLDDSCKEPKIILQANALTKEVEELLLRLSILVGNPACQASDKHLQKGIVPVSSPTPIISGIRNEKLEVLEQESLIRIYASQGRVFAVTAKGEYTLRLRLYEAEERLDRNHFVRISHSEIINLRKVESFDLSFAGTICVSLAGGITTYASRRYVPKIKRLLRI